jgi:hypothetical protein
MLRQLSPTDYAVYGTVDRYRWGIRDGEEGCHSQTLKHESLSHATSSSRVARALDSLELTSSDSADDHFLRRSLQPKNDSTFLLSPSMFLGVGILRMAEKSALFQAM